MADRIDARLTGIRIIGSHRIHERGDAGRTRCGIRYFITLCVATTNTVTCKHCLRQRRRR